MAPSIAGYQRPQRHDLANGTCLTASTAVSSGGHQGPKKHNHMPGNPPHAHAVKSEVPFATALQPGLPPIESPSRAHDPSMGDTT